MFKSFSVGVIYLLKKEVKIYSLECALFDEYPFPFMGLSCFESLGRIVLENDFLLTCYVCVRLHSMSQVASRCQQVSYGYIELAANL